MPAPHPAEFRQRAVALARAGAGPADAVWLVCGASDAPRRLADLAGLGDPAPAADLPEAA